MAMHEKVTHKQLREFGLVTGGIVAVLFGLLLPWLFSAERFPLWPWLVAAGLGGTGLIVPMALRPVYRVWMAFGHVMGWINTRIILGVAFYFIFTPVSLGLWLLRKDPMARKLIASQPSYRVPSSQHDPKHMENPF